MLGDMPCTVIASEKTWIEQVEVESPSTANDVEGISTPAYDKLDSDHVMNRRPRYPHSEHWFQISITSILSVLPLPQASVRFHTVSDPFRTSLPHPLSPFYDDNYVGTSPIR
jgi:hypothetical protein